MTNRIAKVMIPNALDRHAPVTAFTEVAKVLEASGVVDYMQTWDQLAFFWPPKLWNEANTPAAAIASDADSSPDAFVMSGYSLAATPGLGLGISTDSIRRGPAELAQTMLTLANITQGRTVLMMGAGEVKQTRNYGWKRSQGLDRMEDQFQILRKFFDTDAPVNHEGNYWTMREAWLGKAKQYTPKLWALGGGPRLMDLATSYADGFCSMVPYVKSTPEQWAATVAECKRDLERKGRDPDDYEFALWFPAVIHDDDEFIQRALDNPLMKWIAAVCGRLNQADWDAEGLEPPMPRDWHYALRMLPQQFEDTEIDEILARVSHEISARSWLHGSAKDVASEIQDYVDAGATTVCLLDFGPVLLPLDQAATGISRSIDVARILKGK
jgi:phthiodiolone/phenolphthiodiolone dimycocerosates ketoreductase